LIPNSRSKELREEADHRERVDTMTRISERMIARRELAMTLLKLEAHEATKTAGSVTILRDTILTLYGADQRDRKVFGTLINKDRICTPGPASEYTDPVKGSKDWLHEIPHNWRPRNA
jgi:hypothetical protein